METTVQTKQQKESVSAGSKDVQIQKVDIGLINVDPNQPRKTYSKDSLQGLADSIKELGLIQPITVRPSGGKFIIIVGERRYRASKLAGLETVDCMVKELDLDSITEMQIIENLQRENVEPIEEAEAVAKLRQKYSPKEISQRIGRSERFIKLRTKLADLIPDFRTYVVDKSLTLSKAIELANFPEEEQKEIFDGMLQHCQEFNLNYINQACDEMSHDLNKAPFDLNDRELLTTAGACGSCPFNSINQGALFGEDKPVCSKPSCYQNKKHIHFLTILNQAKSDGTMIIPDIRNYNIEENENQLVISYMEQDGFTVYLPNDVDIKHLPTKPTLKQLKKDNYWRELSRKEWKELLAEDVKQYNGELKEYKEAPKKGYVKAMPFNTKSYFGKDVLVKLEDEENKEQPTVNSIPIAQKTMAQCTPQEQIEKIEEREERKIWLENNKSFEEIAVAIRETDYINSKKALSRDEMVALTLILFEDFTKYSKFKTEQMKWSDKSRKKSKLDVVADYKETFKKETLNKAIRYIILQQCHFGETNQTNNIVNASIYNVMKADYTKEVETIEKGYDAKRKERTKKLKSRIQALKAEMKELEK